ncbi:MAG: DUF721 domain-containing protein [Proteobacteria bacterium]|nr:DUF721 domain-containing protein [Pseudomonadota bacterium]
MPIKPNLEKRKLRPQSLGGAFGGLLKIFGARASDSDLAARWAEIAGKDIADMADLAGISKGIKNRETGAGGRTLTIRAKNPAFALALSYRAEEIRIAVNKYFGYDAVSKIKVTK